MVALERSKVGERVVSRGDRRCRGEHLDQVSQGLTLVHTWSGQSPHPSGDDPVNLAQIITV